MADNNPFFISTEGTGITFGQIDDLVDFPHSGIIKALNQMSRGNFAVKGANNFNITQSSSDPIISVATGTYLRDGKQFTTTQAYTFNAAAFTATADNSYYLIVVDSSNVVRLRVPTATNRVAQFTLGDTIIALLEYSSTTSNGARRVQFFTTDKVSNTLSVGYDNSGYTETATITGASGVTTITAASSSDVKVKLAGTAAGDTFEVIDSAAQVQFKVQGDGEIVTDGNITVGGNIIKASDGGSTITMDTSDNVTIAGDLIVGGSDISFPNNAAASLIVAEAASGDDGHDLSISAGSSPATPSGNANGGDLLLSSGAGDGTGTSIMKFSTKVNGTDAIAERMRIDTDGQVKIKSLGVGTAAELTITESSDDITLANTVNDKDIDISVKDGGGTGRRAKFTANTHSNEVILKGIEEVIIVALSDETTNLAAGTAKASFHMPYAMTLSKVKASVNTAPTGSVLTVDINEAGTTILSTKLTIDAGEFTSDTAATAAVISDAALADNALITFDIDGVGSSATGKGLKVTLYGKRT